MQCEIVHRKQNINEPHVVVTLGLSLRKNAGRFDFGVEKATELGVKAIIPMVCERRVRTQENHQGLTKIALSATKQCGRSTLPGIYLVTAFEAVVRDSLVHDLKLIPHEKTWQSRFIDAVL